jgi:hypothetical protein
MLLQHAEAMLEKQQYTLLWKPTDRKVIFFATKKAVAVECNSVGGGSEIT